MATWKADLIEDLKSWMPNDSSDKLSKESLIAIRDALLIETLNSKICCLMDQIILKLLILDLVPAFQIIKKLNFSVELLLIWRLKLFRRQNIVDHLLIFGLLESYFLQCCQVSFHIKEQLMKFCMIKYLELTVRCLLKSMRS